MLMKKLKIILTACGCPGASTLIKYLKNNGEREIEIIGTDMDEQAIGRFLCDKFYKVSEGTSDQFIEELLAIAEKEKVDLLFTESSNEVLNLAKNREKFEQIGVPVPVSSPEAIKTGSNKFLMYEKLKNNPKVKMPAYFDTNNLEDFVQKAKKLGYPEKPVCFKPHEGKGSRGFRIIDDSISRKDLLMNYKPSSRYMSMDEYIEIFKEEREFPKFLLMEYIEGDEVTADTLCFEGKELLTTVKSVEQARWGVIVKGELLDAPEIIEEAREIVKDIGLSYNVNIQFVGGKLIEINTRVSTFIYQDDLIPPYLSIKHALGEITEEEVREYSKKVVHGRRMLRYMDQVFWNPGELK